MRSATNMDLTDLIQMLPKKRNCSLRQPRRFTPKTSPRINNKAIPLHFVYASRTYSADINTLALPQNWALISNKPTKKTKRAMSHLGVRPKEVESIQSRKTSLSFTKEISKTSELLLKYYLKRKHRVFSKDNVTLTKQMVNFDTVDYQNSKKRLTVFANSDDIQPFNSQITSKDLNRKQIANTNENLEPNLVHNDSINLQSEYISQQKPRRSIRWRSFKRIDSAVQQIKQKVYGTKFNGLISYHQ